MLEKREMGGREQGEARAGAAGGDRPGARGRRGRREYGVGNKWVTKIRVEDAAENKGGKFRTLKRRRSDEAETRGKDKAVVGFKRGARKSYTVASGEPMDCLS